MRGLLRINAAAMDLAAEIYHLEGPEGYAGDEPGRDKAPVAVASKLSPHDAQYRLFGCGRREAKWSG